MPRDGSPLSPAGSLSTAPVDIGQVAAPPFAVLADPATLFARRARRFSALAERDEGLRPYLAFLAGLAAAQDGILAGLSLAVLPDETAMDRALEHGMPPLGAVDARDDAVLLETMDALIAAVPADSLPESALSALSRLAAAGAADRIALLAEALAGDVEEHRIAEHVLAAAAVQVHMTRLAALLDADRLKRITDAACPACGAPVVASTVVTWEGASGSRFCACPICATQWHVPRVRCLSCGSEKDITFHGIEGGGDAVKAESCRSCRTYVKIAYQPRDRDVDPIADDVASLALDLLMRGEGYNRSGANPFLIGY